MLSMTTILLMLNAVRHFVMICPWMSRKSTRTRLMFATIYYRVYKDIAKLADILGHSSIETTRIYLMTTGQEHRHQLERLQLVL